jgi:hypothetical protein
LSKKCTLSGAAELLLAETDVGVLTKQVELALFFEAKLDPTAMA